MALEKTRLLFRNAGMAQAVVAINGGILVFVLGGLRPPLWALLWWLAVLAVAAARYTLARRFFAAAPGAADAAVWRRRAVSSATVAGLLWAGGGSALMLADPEATRLFAALIMAGMVAGAVPILSSVPAAFRAYAVPVMASIVLVALFDLHGTRDAMLAVVAVLYLFALLRSARYFHESLDDSIRLALHMRELVGQLDEARRRADASSQAKSRFLATMSHEIRTPMNAILGMAQALMAPALPEGERQDYVRTLFDSGQTLLRVLNDILDLSKVEAGKLEIVPGEFAAAKAVGDTLALFEPAARAKGLALEAQWLGETDGSYWADGSRVRQMLANLVNNAIKFTPQGHVRVVGREVERDATDAVLEFAVADSGIGIPAEHLGELFQPFRQIDSSTTREFGGTGLGLSIVRLLAEQMGGTAGVASTPGEGSRFWFRIRAQVLAEVAEAHQAAVAEPAPAALPGARILVVEDNAVNRKVVEALLAKRGYRIEFAENGLLAVAAVTGATPPDLVLMDCQMPVMDGYEATRQIRTLEAASGNARIPIVALTAGAYAEDRSRCFDAGMDDFLAKPIDARELERTLATWLRRN